MRFFLSFELKNYTEVFPVGQDLNKNCPEPKFQIVLLDGLFPRIAHFTPKTPEIIFFCFFLQKLCNCFFVRFFEKFCLQVIQGHPWSKIAETRTFPQKIVLLSNF